MQEHQPKTNRLKEAEKKLRAYMIAGALIEHKCDRQKTADWLGITRAHLNKLLILLRIDIEQIRADMQRKKPAAPTAIHAMQAGA